MMAVQAKNTRASVTPTRLSNYISRQVEALRGIKSQREIASEIGYPKANIISMFKTGEAKVPLEKLPPLARALGVDLGLLLRLGIEQYMPEDTEAWRDIHKLMERLVTDNEMEIIVYIREVSDNTDPHLDEDRKVDLKRSFGIAEDA
jgi:hypothetical protein